MVVNIYGYEIEYTKDMLASLKLISAINGCKKRMINDFKKIYWNSGNILNVVDKAENHIYGGWYEMCEVLAKDLIARGVFGVTADDIFKDFCSYTRKVDNVLDEVTSKICSITERYDKEKEYRALRKANRGKVVGGGFGLKGAVKGMATAGTVNMATGAVHSVVNVFGNMGSSIAQSNRLNELYRSGVLEKIVKAIEEDSNQIIAVCKRVYNRNTKVVFFYDLEMAKKAEGIYRQLKEELIAKEQLYSAVAQMLFFYPFCEEYFELAFDKLGDYGGNLTEYSKLVGYDNDYTSREEKKKIAEEKRRKKEALYGRREGGENDVRLESIVDMLQKNDYLTELVANGELLYHTLQVNIAYICTYFSANREAVFSGILVTFDIMQKRFKKYYEMCNEIVKQDEFPLLLVINPQSGKYDFITSKRVITLTNSIEIMDIQGLDKKSTFSFLNAYTEFSYIQLVQAILIYIQCLKTEGSEEKIPGLGGKKDKEIELVLSEKKDDSELLIEAETIEDFVYKTYQESGGINILTEKYINTIDNNKKYYQDMWDKIINKQCSIMEKEDKIVMIALCGEESRGIVFTERYMYIYSKSDIKKTILYQDIEIFDAASSQVVVNNIMIKNRIFDPVIPWGKWMSKNGWKIIKHFLLLNGEVLSLEDKGVKIEPSKEEKKITNNDKEAILTRIADVMFENFMKAIEGDTLAMQKVVKLAKAGAVIPVECILVDTYIDVSEGGLDEERRKYYSNVFGNNIRNEERKNYVLAKDCEFLYWIHSKIAMFGKNDLFYVQRRVMPNESLEYGQLLDEALKVANFWENKKYKIIERKKQIQSNSPKNVIKSEKVLCIILEKNIKDLWTYLEFYFGMDETLAKMVDNNHDLLVYKGTDYSKAMHYYYICKYLELPVKFILGDMEIENTSLAQFLEKSNRVEEQSNVSSIVEKTDKKETMFCTCCGKVILRTSKFCNYCGGKVTYSVGS